MEDYTNKLEFDQKAGVIIQTGKLETIKKIIEAIESDLNEPEIEKYHSAAIAIQVLYDYLEKGGGFYRECKLFLERLKSHFNNSEKHQSPFH